jgi:hypothetical protein
MTRNRALCDEEGMLSPDTFEIMLREQARDDAPALACCMHFRLVAPVEQRGAG